MLLFQILKIIGQEQAFGLTTRKQIDIADDGTLQALRTNAAERLSLVADGGGNAINGHHVDATIAFGYDLCCRIVDAVYIDRENGHGTGRNGEARKVATRHADLNIAFCRQLFQTGIVVDKDEGALTIGAIGPA